MLKHLHEMPDSLHAARRRCRRLLAAAAFALLLATMALTIDLPMRSFARYQGRGDIPGDLRKLVELVEVFGHGSGVALCLLVPLVLDRRGWRLLPRMMAGAYGAGLVADLIKLLIARERPKHSSAATVWETFIGWLPIVDSSRLGKPWNHALESFPSGHTATAVGFCIALSVLYPRGRWLFAAFAVLAALQRVFSGMHYVSDTLVAAAVACLVGAALHGPTRLNAWLQQLESHTPTPASDDC